MNRVRSSQMPEGSPLRFAGYAGLFDIPDADRDIIRKGAFFDTLKQPADQLPLLWQHRPDQPIGWVEHIAEDRRGLRVIAHIDRTNSRGAKMLGEGSANGLSFGYRVRKSRISAKGRELLDIDLFEISLVTHPLQFGARVHLILQNQ